MVALGTISFLPLNVIGWEFNLYHRIFAGPLAKWVEWTGSETARASTLCPLLGVSFKDFEFFADFLGHSAIREVADDFRTRFEGPGPLFAGDS
jgi:hypothetical protein